MLSLDGDNTTELAKGLDPPTGVAVGGEGAVYVAEASAGRVVKLPGGKTQTVVDGLARPEGVAVSGSRLYVVGAAKDLVETELATGAPDDRLQPACRRAARHVVRQLGSVGDMCGPMYAFTGVAIGGDGAVHVAGDADGSVLAVRRI